MSITFSECVFVALGIQQATHINNIVICGMPVSTKYVFQHYPIKNVLNTKCVFWFSLQISPEKFLSLRRTERDMTTIVYRSSCKVPAILVRFKETSIFIYVSSKNAQISSFMKIRQSEPSCCMHTDGRTDVHDEANSRSSQFREAPKNIGKLLPIILKYMDQGTEIWQILSDNHVPPLWRLHFSARIINDNVVDVFLKVPTMSR
jgi:hypothetical protein